MQHFDLTEEQAATLADVLSFYLSDLRAEISRTDNRGVRQDLKEKEVIIKEILHTINGPDSPM